MTNNQTYILKCKGINSVIFQQCLDIRRKVFIEEQNIPKELENDVYDSVATHYLLILNNIPPINIGTARWRETDKGIKLERFAVLKEFRNKGFGKIILNEIIKDIIDFNKLIYLHAQKDAVKFYLKNNFKITGQPFYEANIEHYLMVYNTQ